MESSKKKDIIEQRMDDSFAMNANRDGMRSDQRSAFEGSQYRSNQNAFERKSYEKQGFDASDKKFSTSDWDSRKSYNDGKLETPEFAQRTADVNRQQSDWGEKNYATSANNEMSKTWAQSGDKKVEHKIDGSITHSRDSVARPKIVDSQEYQQKTIEDVRSMMGRGENDN